MRSTVTESQECRHGSTQKFRQGDPDNVFFVSISVFHRGQFAPPLRSYWTNLPQGGPFASRGRFVRLLLEGGPYFYC